eukprot:m.60104 g.60104  ORF g.60104 m.60104 type:complete len:695 (+) comp19161_c0_seq1:121-2205(+)
MSKRFQKQLSRVVSDDLLSSLLGRTVYQAFKAAYIGSSVLNKGSKKEEVNLKVGRVLASNQSIKVWLCISRIGVAIIDRETFTLINVIPYHCLRSTMTTTSTPQPLALIGCDARLPITYLHVFVCKNKTTPNEFNLSLAKGSKQAAEQQDQQEATNHPVPTDLTEEAMHLGDNVLEVFEGQYLGAVPIQSKAFGDQAAEESFQKLMKKIKKKDPSPTHILIVTKSGVRTYETLTETRFLDLFIEAVSFVTVLEEGKEEEIFALFEHNENLDTTEVHFYQCEQNIPDELCRTIGNARDLQEEEKQKTRPFDAISVNSAVIPEAFLNKHIPREDLEPGLVLGSGQFGVVYQAIQRQENQENFEQRAVKILHRGAPQNHKEDFLREAEITTLLNHDNVVKLIGVSFDSLPMLAVFELLQYSDLRKVLRGLRNKGLETSVREKLIVMKQLASGFGYIIDQGFLHMDIAARNILLHTDNVVKIADFGCAQRMDPATKKYKLTATRSLSVRWLAPECVRSGPVFSEKTDVYSLGTTFWEIASYGRVPYKGMKAIEVKEKLGKGLSLEQPKDCPERLWKIICQCHAAPEYRPPFQALHSILVEYEKDTHFDFVEVRDIGALLNSRLTERLQSFAKTASQSQLRRRTSSLPTALPLEEEDEGVQDPLGNSLNGRVGGVVTLKTATQMGLATLVDQDRESSSS